MWDDMEKWVKDHVKKEYGKVTAVGTGGNISKIFEIAKKKPGQALSIKKVKDIRKMIESHTLEQRIYELQMNPDRADVIIPATDIYTKVMEWAKATNIIVPDVGLKDGILLHLLEKNVTQKKIEFKNSTRF
jgi:exopolyphosphatase/guanosine-5'-triphosphate,3'-diphosphate pyrophosphatase